MLTSFQAAGTVTLTIRYEMKLHLAECKELGITQGDIEASEELPGVQDVFDCDAVWRADFAEACTAYSRYVLDIGQSEDWLALQIALLPCLLGYGVIARRLHVLQTESPPARPNRYLKWINNYLTEEYNEAVKESLGK